MTTPLDNKRDLTPGEDGPLMTVPSHVSIPALAARNPDERRAGFILLLLAFLSGCVLILPTLTAGPLVLDEYGTWWLAGRDNPLTLWERSLNYENIPPLSPFLHRLFVDVLGQSEAAFRLPSVLWFLLTIGVAWLLGRQLVGPVAGGLTALVVAWHPNALGEVRIARCYSLTLLLSSLLFWITLRWSATADRGRYAVAWSVVAAALLWTHYLNLAVVVVCLIPLVWQLRIMPISARLALTAATLAVAVSGIPLLSPLLRMSVWGESFGFQGETPIADIISPLWWLGFPVGWITAWLLDRVWFRRTATGTMRVPRKHVRLLLFWGLLPSLLAALLCHGSFASLANPRYRIGFAGAAAATDTDLNRASLKGFQTLLASQQFQAIDRVEHSDCILLHYTYKPLP